MIIIVKKKNFRDQNQIPESMFVCLRNQNHMPFFKKKREIRITNFNWRKIRGEREVGGKEM